MEELLRILEKNARMPIEDIAAMLDKTPEEIAAMMDEAAAKGYIRGYETLVDWEQAGVNLVEAVIELRVTPHKARGFDDIGMTIAQFDEVDTVLLMSGSYDLQVIIQGPQLSGNCDLRGQAPLPAGRCALHRHQLCAAPLQARRSAVSGRRTR